MYMKNKPKLEFNQYYPKHPFLKSLIKYFWVIKSDQKVDINHKILIWQKKIITVIVISLLSISCINNNDSILVTNWQIQYSQNEHLDSVISADEWQDIDILKPIKLPYPVRKTYQYVWLKGSFTSTKDHEKYYGISISDLFMVDRVYVNRNLVGYKNPDEINNFDSPRNYVIPKGIILKDKNTLFIRAGVYDEWEIEIGNKILIQKPEEFKKTRQFYRLLFEFLPLSILAILFATFLSLIIKSVSDKWNKEHLFMAFRLMIIIICYLTLFSPVHIFSIRIIIAIWYCILPLLLICILIYYQALYKVYFTTLNLILISLLIIISFVLFSLKYINKTIILPDILLLLSIVTAIIYFVYIIKNIIKIKYNNYKLIIVSIDFGILLLNVFIVALFLTFGITIIDPSLLGLISAIILTLLFSIYYTRREGLQKKKLESLILKLKVIEEKSNNKTKFTISSSLEEKLKEVTFFIKEHYSEPITREELAEAVGINSNYFSTLFNIITGKKVNEYINDLRLIDTAEKLVLSRNTIIDIAFSTGFESIPTFNRLFKKKYNCTPKEYRKNNYKDLKKIT